MTSYINMKIKVPILTISDTEEIKDSISDWSLLKKSVKARAGGR